VKNTHGSTSSVAVPPPRRRRVDLVTLRDIRAELASLYRRIDRDEIKSQDGSRRAFVLRTLADVVMMADIEPRLSELETATGVGNALPSHRVPGGHL
jgi:hypothetical protein